MSPYASSMAVLVNDDPSLLAMLTASLDQMGIRAESFASVEEAITYMGSEAAPDLIVTDIRMPGIDGWQFCRLLRSPEYARFNAVPILAVSATFAGDDPVRLAADIGADRFIPVPVDEQVFSETVLALLSGAGGPAPVPALLVEDDPSLSAVLERALTTHGYCVTAVPSCSAAGKAISAHPFQLAVIDYVLPDGKGDRVLQSLLAAHSDCVCLMMTGHPDPALALGWMKLGMAAYLHKPFDPRYLIEVCARARKERAMRRSADLLEARVRQIREQDAQYREDRRQVEHALRVSAAQLRKLAGHLQSVREREQRRIAVWLHDDVGQLLTRMRMDVMLLEGSTHAPDPESQEVLHGLKQTLDEALNTVRRIAMELRPSILDDFGLVAALTWSIREDEKRLRIPISFETDNVPDPLPEDLSVAIYRMARECLTNIARHARAWGLAFD